MKKIILVTLLTGSVFLNTACDDREIAAGIIGVGIGIGIAAGDNDDHDHHHRRRDYDNGYRDGRHDGRHHGGHRGRDRRPPPRYRGYALETTFATSLDAKAVDSDVLAFSEKYKISTDAAVKVQKAFTGVEAKGTESFATIGLSKKDIRTIAKRELPASSSIKSMADKLDISEAQSRDLIKDLIKEFEVQASSVASPYWQSCMGKGKWRTPQNLYCKNTAWNGCSPETGATLCY